MTEIYNPGQAQILFSHWPFASPIDWFVIGGPSNANEAQTIAVEYPGIKCIGFDPDPVNIKIQKELFFPGTVHQYALWNKDTKLELTIKPGNHKVSSVARNFEGDSYDTLQVNARTLDSLNEEYGPFTNCVLWLDIELAEEQALEGATDLLTNHVKLINIEAYSEEIRLRLLKLLGEFGFSPVHYWNTRSIPGLRDVILRKL